MNKKKNHMDSSILINWNAKQEKEKNIDTKTVLAERESYSKRVYQERQERHDHTMHHINVWNAVLIRRKRCIFVMTLQEMKRKLIYVISYIMKHIFVRQQQLTPLHNLVIITLFLFVSIYLVVILSDMIYLVTTA